VAQTITDDFCEHLIQTAPIGIAVLDSNYMFVRDGIVFDAFLVEMSARFVAVHPAQIESEIAAGLRNLSKLLDVDWVSFAKVAPADEARFIGSYLAPEAEPFFGLNGTTPAWYLKEIKLGKTMRFTRVEDLGLEAADMAAYACATGIKSHIGAPIFVDGVARYWLGVSTLRRESKFSEDVVMRLHLVGEIFAGALARRDADVSLRRMQTELAHVTRVSTVGQLAASIAHEINQPLLAVVSNAQAAIRLLSMDQPDLTEALNALKDIVAGGKRAGDIVQRSHRMLKRREMALEPTEINEVVRDVASLAHSEALIRHVNIELELGENLADVLGDRVQLQQVMLNLIMNAIDAASEVSDGPRQITISSEMTATHVRVMVRDTGKGLLGETEHRLFEPFYTTKPHGLGMGLTISRDIVHSHGGVLKATANLPRGACLVCELPRKERVS
jgi:signal transduction histidine kinase